MTIETEAKINKVSSSIICKFLRGTATATETAGKGVGIAGAVAGSALIATGNAVIKGSSVVRDKSEVAAKALRAKADSHDLSSVSIEEIAEQLKKQKNKEFECTLETYGEY